jgi:hypothetical protein
MAVKLTSNWPMSGTIMTASQHLHMATILRRGAGKPGYPSTEKAEEMAKGHEHLARMIVSRWARHLAAMAPDVEYMRKPEEHRQTARKLRSYIGNPDAGSPERLEQMAQEHEQMARALAKAGGRITDHKSPSIIPSLAAVEKQEPLSRERSRGKLKPAALQLRFPGF